MEKILLTIQSLFLRTVKTKVFLYAKYVVWSFRKRSEIIYLVMDVQDVKMFAPIKQSLFKKQKRSGANYMIIQTSFI